EQSQHHDRADADAAATARYAKAAATAAGATRILQVVALPEVIPTHRFAPSQAFSRTRLPRSTRRRDHADTAIPRLYIGFRDYCAIADDFIDPSEECVAIKSIFTLPAHDALRRL